MRLPYESIEQAKKNSRPTFPILKEYTCLTPPCMEIFERVYQSEQEAAVEFQLEECSMCGSTDIGINTTNIVRYESNPDEEIIH